MNNCVEFFFLGLMKADEIMVINGAIVSDLDMMFIESVLQEELTLCMMLRSSRTGIYFFEIVFQIHCAV